MSDEKAADGLGRGRCPVCDMSDCPRVTSGRRAKDGSALPCRGNMVNWRRRALVAEAAAAGREHLATMFVVRRSRMIPDLLSYGQWDDEAGRVSATKAKLALSKLLTDLGAESGDEVELTARITKKAEP